MEKKMLTRDMLIKQLKRYMCSTFTFTPGDDGRYILIHQHEFELDFHIAKSTYGGFYVVDEMRGVCYTTRTDVSSLVGDLYKAFASH
jgi:hypothetical protein